MRIAFDGTTLIPAKSGVGFYSEHLLSHLATEFGDDEWIVLSNRPVSTSEPLPEHLRVDLSGGLPWRVPWIQFTAPARLNRLQVDLAHFTNSICPLRSPVPTVLTIHDMSLELFPGLHPRRRRLTRRLVRRCAHRAQAIIAVSESARGNICSILGIHPRKVVVVREAAAPAFRPVRNRRLLKAVTNRYGLPDRFMLHVGTIEPRKNLVSLVEAFARIRALRQSGLGLVLAGSWGWGFREVKKTIRRLGLSGSVRLPGYVAFDDLPALYSLASFTIYPSLHEGFGLPVIEAMACGSPVVTSPNSSLFETAGQAALMLEGTDPGSISRAIGRLLDHPRLREELSSRSLQNAERFSWTAATRETYEVYRKVVTRGTLE